MKEAPVRVAPFDPADPAFVADPYPVFATLRAEGEVHPHGLLGFPVAVSHAAASAVLRSPRLGRIWRDATPTERFVSFNLLHRNSMLETEGARHTRLRRLVAGAFNRGHTDRLRPTVQAIADRLVAGVAERIADDGVADLMPLLAAPLPVEVIGALLGVPESDRPLLQPWSNSIVKMYEYGLPGPLRDEAELAASEFVAYLRELIRLRRSRPGDDIVSDLVAAGRGPDGVLEDVPAAGPSGSAGLDGAAAPTGAAGARGVGDDAPLTVDEVVGTAALLLMAGHEATVNVLGNGVHALLAHPGQWRLLLDRGPDVVGSAVEELIRFDSPLQSFERTAIEDTVIAGHEVRAGEKIAALLGAAARDARVFADPDTLDITRSRNPHLGFGAGSHYCLGAPLARVEVQAALLALRSRLPGLRAAGEPTRRGEFVIRGLTALPVTADRPRG